MQSTAEKHHPQRAGTWPATGTAATAALPPAFAAAMTSVEPSKARDEATAAFEACCRALSHKANTALVAQLPVLQQGSVIDLTRNYVGAAGLQAVSLVLPHNPNVVELRAPRNGLTNDAVVIFARAMRGHQRLAVLDFSENSDISLAGGLALLSLAQQLSSLRAVDVEGTHIPDAVRGKLSRALAANGARRAVAAADLMEGEGRAGVETTTVAAAGESRRAVSACQKSRDETATLASLAARVRRAVSEGYQLPPAVPQTGWRVLEIPVLAPPFLFETEIQLLCTKVFPRLNEEFAPHKLVLRPVVVPGAPGSTSSGHEGDSVDAKIGSSSMAGGKPKANQRTIGSYNRELHFLPVCDVTAAVARGRFAAIELVGDRAGDYAQIPASAMHSLHQHCLQSSNKSSSNVSGGSEEAEGTHLTADGQRHSSSTAESPLSLLQPVLYTAHEAALQSTRWLLVATRRDTRAMQVPAALAPLLTADPSVAHPDRHRSVVRDVVYDGAAVAGPDDHAEAPRPAVTFTAQRHSSWNAAEEVAVAAPGTLTWDYATEEQQWWRHQAMRRHVVESAPVEELVMPQYGAVFDRTDAQGTVLLKDLDSFETGIYNRLRVLVRCCLDGDGDAMTESGEGCVQGEANKDASTDSQGGMTALFTSIATQRRWVTTLVQAVAAVSSGSVKKNIVNRVVLYAANPPSRNALLLHAHDAAGMSLLMARTSSRLLSLQHAYTLALYSALSAVVLEEPTDLRSFVVETVSQLTTDAAVLRYVHAEVDAERLCAFFMQMLSGTVKSGAPARAGAAGGVDSLANAEPLFTAAGLPAYVAHYVLPATVPAAAAAAAAAAGATRGHGTGSSTHAFVVVVDGMDLLQPMVQPCGALVHHSSGLSSAGAGSRAEPARWSDEHNAAALPDATEAPRSASGRSAAKVDALTPWGATMPRALARNVRVIASCVTDGATHSALRHLGRDSVETLSLGPVSANEVEQFLSPALLARVGLAFSEDDFECARSKKDASMGEYMRYLLDAARAAQEVPGTLTQSQVIRDFPDTIAEAAQAVYDRLVSVFGLPLSRTVLGLLTASRWGLTLPELRVLLPQLSACRLQALLRVLRPVLEQEMPPEPSALMSSVSGNALLGSVRLTVQSFLDVVRREALEAVAEDTQLEQDHRVWHTQLAQYYLSVVHKSLSAARAAQLGAQPARLVRVTATLSDGGNSPSIAEQRRALKEVIYHMTQSGAFWPQLDVTILSLPFLQLVYANGLGYAFLRDLTAAFNERYKRHLLGEDIGDVSWQRGEPSDGKEGSAAAPAAEADAAAGHALPAVLSRMRDYVRFAHEHGLLLSLRPSLVPQVALQIPASALNSVQRDTVAYLYRHLLAQPPSGTTQADASAAQQADSRLRRAVFFTSLANSSSTAAAAGRHASTHLGPITCAAFLPNRKFVVTASRDRSLAWVHPHTGAVSWQARQPTAPVESLVVCRTSAYVAAVTEDRTLWIYDGLQGKLVTQCRGSEWFDAPITSVVFSARGRYVWVVTSDTRARCFECESGLLRCSLGVAEVLGTSRGTLPTGADDDAAAAAAVVMVSGDGDAALAEMVQCSATEWRQRRNYLSVLPDPHEDEVCTTLVAREVRQWRMQPWQLSDPRHVGPSADEAGEGEGGAAAAAPPPAELDVHAKGTLLAFQRTVACRLAADTRASTSASTVRETEGYKVIQAWEGVSPLAVRAVAVPVRAAAEVHLLELDFPAWNGRTVCPAVRCVAAPAVDGDAVCAMSPSPDGCWLAVGMTSGTIHLFGIGAARRAWLDQQQPQQQPQQLASQTIVCELVCVYTGLVPGTGLTGAPIHSLCFHRDGGLLFGLGRSLKAWRLPSRLPVPAAETLEVGEYVVARSPTCLAVLPAPLPPGSDSELPSGVTEVCVGDETGRLTLLRLWKPTF